MRGVRVCVAVSATVVALAAAAIGPLAASARAAQAVDVALVLAADVSRSINDEEFALQRRGYAAAIANPTVLDAIRSGRHGAIAVSFVEWAGEAEQKTVVDWTLIGDAADARKFAAALSRTRRDPMSGARRSDRRSISPSACSARAASSPTAPSSTSPATEPATRADP